MRFWYREEIALFRKGVNNSVLTIEDTNPYAVYIADKSFLKPTEEGISTINGSLNAAIVRNEENSQSISIVTVSNPVYSKNNNELTLEVKPLTFYDGTILKNFADKNQDLTSETTGKVTLTRVFLEINQKAPENCVPEWGDCDYHGGDDWHGG